MDIFKNTQIISLIANLGALSVLGYLYAAYIKNLKSSLSLKADQITTLEKRLDMWRENASEMERRTPEYIESILAERIRIREEELFRLKEDGKNNVIEVEERNAEILT